MIGLDRIVRPAVLGLLVTCLAAGCTGPAEPPAAPTAPTAPTALPTPAAPPPPSAPSVPAAPEQVREAPLALVVHRSHRSVDVPRRLARDLLAGATTTWERLGLRGSTVQLLAAPGVDAAAARQLVDDAAVVAAVAADPSVLGLVSAHAVTPDVRVLRVGGHDPLRDVDSYPLRTLGPGAPAVATLTVMGDVMLGRRVGAAMLAQGDFAAPLRRTAARLAAADLTIANFESTLSRDGSPTQGTDSFAADPRVEQGLLLAGIDVLSLANNHVGDWGQRALRQTVRRVRAMGIAPVGAGADLARARRPVVVTVAGVRIGVIATDSIGESPAAGVDRPAPTA